MSLQEDLKALAAAKERVKDWQDAVKEFEQLVIDGLKAAGQKSVSANNGDLVGTLVEGSVIEIDPEGLKKALGPAMWKKVTKQVLDKEKLEAHIAIGDVDANVVAGVSKEKDRKPYVKVTGTTRPKKTRAKKAPTPVQKGRGKSAAAKKIGATRVRPKK